jgi:hypothetical protein
MTVPQPPELYRSHLKTDGDHAQVIAYCLDNGVVGMGWGLQWDGRSRPADYDDWCAQAWEIWPDQPPYAVGRLHDAPLGSLVWTRDLGGIFHLGRLEGPWEYRDSKRNHALDVSNVRAARWVRVGVEDRVPGAVVRALSRRGSTFERVKDWGAAWYSAFVYADLVGEAMPSWKPTVAEVVDSLLGPLDVQDLVAAYLQDQVGYIALPARYSDHTAAYEFVLRDPDTGHIAVAQVKTGDAWIDPTTLPDDPEVKVYLFSFRGRYPDELPPRFEPLDPADVLDFMQSRRTALPPVCERWLDLVA